MTDMGQQTDEARAEAAQWVSRLNSLPVSTDTLQEFFAWRRVEDHRAAYDEVAGVWDAAAGLAGRPAMEALADEAYRRDGRGRPGPTRRRAMAFAAVAAAIIAAGAAVTFNRYSMGDTYRTTVGEQSVVTLEDGSRIALDTGTDLRVRFTSGARHVELEHGQAYFTVAHNPARPFVVDAADTDVVATGTQFDVRRLGDAVDVTLVQGGVRITPPDREATQLVAGQRFSLRGDHAPDVRTVDIASVTAWRQGRIVLDGMPLSEAVAEVNRYAHKPVRLDAGRFAGERFGGSFAVGDIDSFVAAVTAVLPLKAVRDADGSVHLTNPDAVRNGQTSSAI